MGPARDRDRVLGLERRGEVAGGRALDADDPDLFPSGFHGQTQTGEQTAATHGADDGFGVFHLLKNFQTDGPLAGDDVRRVETVDIGQALLGGEPVGFGPGFGEVAAFHDDPRAEALRRADFDQRRVVGHDHRDRDAEQLAVIGERGGVVAGGGGNDPAFLLVAGEAQQGVACPALLERAGALQVVEFAVDAGAGDF